jgi:hypothetical protein
MKKIIYNSMVVLQNLQECISVTLWLSIIVYPQHFTKTYNVQTMKTINSEGTLHFLLNCQLASFAVIKV